MALLNVLLMVPATSVDYALPLVAMAKRSDVEFLIDDIGTMHDEDDEAVSRTMVSVAGVELVLLTPVKETL